MFHTGMQVRVIGRGMRVCGSVGHVNDFGPDGQVLVRFADGQFKWLGARWLAPVSRDEVM